MTTVLYTFTASTGSQQILECSAKQPSGEAWVGYVKHGHEVERPVTKLYQYDKILEFETEDEALAAAEHEARRRMDDWGVAWRIVGGEYSRIEVEEMRKAQHEQNERINAAKAAALDEDMSGWMEREVAEALRDKINGHAGEKIATLNHGLGPNGAGQVRQVWVNCGGRSYVVTTWREYMAFRIGVYGDFARAA